MAQGWSNEILMIQRIRTSRLSIKKCLCSVRGLRSGGPWRPPAKEKRGRAPRGSCPSRPSPSLNGASSSPRPAFKFIYIWMHRVTCDNKQIHVWVCMYNTWMYTYIWIYGDIYVITFRILSLQRLYIIYTTVYVYALGCRPSPSWSGASSSPRPACPALYKSSLEINI